jgi:hypothetical protein
MARGNRTRNRTAIGGVVTVMMVAMLPPSARPRRGRAPCDRLKIRRAAAVSMAGLSALIGVATHRAVVRSARSGRQEVPSTCVLAMSFGLGFVLAWPPFYGSLGTSSASSRGLM